MSQIPAPLIDPARLQALLGPARGRFDVDALAECGSTSSLLMERATRGAPSGSVLVADRQTAGRGRRGRHWLSSPESGLTFSVLWRFDGDLGRLAGLSLVVGIAVRRALAGCGVPGIKLKWPNDLLLDDGKLGGILVELQSERNSMLAVIGIGLNLELPATDAERLPFGQPVAALAQAIFPLPDRHDLLAAILIALAAVLDQFSAAGFTALRSEWQSYNAWQNRPVRLLRDGLVEMEGICRGADVDGALLIGSDTGIERCLSGDLSLRAA
ncbi:MAG: biotin--[acetyl-CoA-carboxylase] ligase [Betaproteobacteria bacterium]|nr:biotin--[acetyl-CoA-carboxylase] ligase [Betaproteobacteria bacterium]